MKMLCASLLLFSSAAVAQAPAVAPVAASVASNSVAPKLICEKQTDIGTRLASRKICGTKEQWAQRRADSVERARKAQAGGNPGSR